MAAQGATSLSSCVVSGQKKITPPFKHGYMRIHYLLNKWIKGKCFQGILNLSNSPSVQLRCRLWRRLFPAHPGSDAWVTWASTNRQPADPANRIRYFAGWNPKLTHLWSNMSDNAESPTESQKEEPQPAPEDSTTNDQKKKSRHAYTCTCI